MLRSKLAVLVALIICFSAILLAWNESANTALRDEVASLKREVDRLNRFESQLSGVRADIASLQRNLDKKPAKSKAIAAKTYLPNGSHLDDPYLGNSEAEALVMAFIDYQCKPCRSFARETFPLLKQNFIETKQIKFVLRDFPLKTNSNARRAAALAHCAGEQGAYWKMNRLLFDNPQALDEGQFAVISTQADGVHQEKLGRCLASDRYAGEIDKDIEEGRLLGAKGAPGFFVGRKNGDGSYRGVFIRGAQPYPVIAAQIQRALAG